MSRDNSIFALLTSNNLPTYLVSALLQVDCVEILSRLYQHVYFDIPIKLLHYQKGYIASAHL